MRRSNHLGIIMLPLFFITIIAISVIAETVFGFLELKFSNHVYERYGESCGLIFVYSVRSKW